MLVLFETSVGYGIFKLTDEKKLQKVDKLYESFETPAKASATVKLEHFERFKDANEALTSITSAIEGKMSKKLKKCLKKIVVNQSDAVLAVADPKLGSTIKDKLSINCVATDAVQKLMSCIRGQIESLIPEWSPEESNAMQLAVSHGLGRYKLKFSPDKVDTMIVQAVSLLDDLDKELNNYVMRCKEWYGWHFPELSKVIQDNSAYVRTVLAIGMKTNAATSDLSDILPEEIEARVKEVAEVSMGTEISEQDLFNIQFLARNVLDLQEYRTQLYEYLKKRMMAIAPNLTILVGEVVGARLISHAGSLINLAKHPASTVQILGAEKALFRALKAHHDTPKYGLIYHAQLVGQSNPKLKGKMSRMLAAKSALATRVDALGDVTSNELGIEHRAKLEARLKFLEEGGLRKISGTGKGRAAQEKYQHQSIVAPYKPAADSTLATSGVVKKEEVKDETKDEETSGEPTLSRKEKKKLKREQKLAAKAAAASSSEQETVAEKEEAEEDEDEPSIPEASPKKEKKKDKKGKKHKLIEDVTPVDVKEEVKEEPEAEAEDVSESKPPKKKKKKQK